MGFAYFSFLRDLSKVLKHLVELVVIGDWWFGEIGSDSRGFVIKLRVILEKKNSITWGWTPSLTSTKLEVDFIVDPQVLLVSRVLLWSHNPLLHCHIQELFGMWLWCNINPHVYVPWKDCYWKQTQGRFLILNFLPTKFRNNGLKNRIKTLHLWVAEKQVA